MSNQINAENQFPVGTWVSVEDFPIGADMKVVKILDGEWRGVRYRSNPNKLEYGEFHVDELIVADNPNDPTDSDEPESNTGILTNFQ